MRLRAPLVALVAGTLGLGGCATSSTAAPTRAQAYAPSLTSASTVRPAISATASGTCWEGSLALYQDPSAWRCTAANQIMDPCFAPHDQPDAAQLICTSAPWAPAIRLDLTQPLPLGAANSTGSGPRPVWAFELVNGDRCVLGTGTAPQVGTVVLDYVCTSGANAGGLDRGHQQWTVEYRAVRSSAVRSLAVRTAWD